MNTQISLENIVILKRLSLQIHKYEMFFHSLRSSIASNNLLQFLAYSFCTFIEFILKYFLFDAVANGIVYFYNVDATVDYLVLILYPASWLNLLILIIFKYIPQSLLEARSHHLLFPFQSGCFYFFLLPSCPDQNLQYIAFLLEGQGSEMLSSSTMIEDMPWKIP